jgi:tripartite-type tricarboxylate transporter receptor subunit TctC
MVTSPQRLEALPDVPTATQAGHPAFELRSWGGIVAAPSVPAAALPRLAGEIAKVFAEPEVRGRFASRGVILTTGTPEAFGAMIGREIAKWAPVIRNAKIKVD